MQEQHPNKVKSGWLYVLQTITNVILVLFIFYLCFCRLTLLAVMEHLNIQFYSCHYYSSIFFQILVLMFVVTASGCWNLFVDIFTHLMRDITAGLNGNIQHNLQINFGHNNIEITEIVL